MSTHQISEQAAAAREQGRQADGRFGPTVSPEAQTDLTSHLAPSPMSHEDHRHLAVEYGSFASGYTPEDVDAMLGGLEGAEMVVVWDEHSEGDFAGDSEIVGRVGDGPWRRVSPEVWSHLTGESGHEHLEGGSCAECGGEMVVEEDGVAHHLTAGGEVDHDADADHVALDDEEYGEPAPPPELPEGTPLLSDEVYEHQDLDDRYRSGANIAFETEDYDEDSCSECGASLDDGEGYDGRCGNCADREEVAELGRRKDTAVAAADAWEREPSEGNARAMYQAADDLVSQGRDIGAETDDLEDAYDHEDANVLVTAIRSFEVPELDGDEGYDPELARSRLVGAGYDEDLARAIAGSSKDYDSAYEQATLAGGR